MDVAELDGLAYVSPDDDVQVGVVRPCGEAGGVDLYLIQLTPYVGYYLCDVTDGHRL